MEEFKLAVFGAYTWGQLFGFIWFFIIGYLYTFMDETSRRDRDSINTPKAWSLKFWFFDNWRRYLVTLLATYLFFRFYLDFTGHELTYFECVMVGIIGDGLGASAKARIKIVKGNRTELLKKP